MTAPRPAETYFSYIPERELVTELKPKRLVPRIPPSTSDLQKWHKPKKKRKKKVVFTAAPLLSEMKNKDLEVGSIYSTFPLRGPRVW